EAVEFHEVGAVDTVVDVVGACQGFAALGLDRLVVSPVALGGGQTQTMHGAVPVPVPAVLELLAGSSLVGYGGPVDVELATPTGVAILAELADASGPMPAMAVDRSGIGLGGRDRRDRYRFGRPPSPASVHWHRPVRRGARPRSGWRALRRPGRRTRPASCRRAVRGPRARAPVRRRAWSAPGRRRARPAIRRGGRGRARRSPDTRRRRRPRCRPRRPRGTRPPPARRRVPAPRPPPAARRCSWRGAVPPRRGPAGQGGRAGRRAGGAAGRRRRGR
ncbi:MAG: DUF111 family protein, partial [Frankiales bacterium]|nr:DUF111 family protein [Frankiales bacterium]